MSLITKFLTIGDYVTLNCQNYGGVPDWFSEEVKLKVNDWLIDRLSTRFLSSWLIDWQVVNKISFQLIDKLLHLIDRLPINSSIVAQEMFLHSFSCNVFCDEFEKVLDMTSLTVNIFKI